jgi:hypothetical protein
MKKILNSYVSEVKELMPKPRLSKSPQMESIVNTNGTETNQVKFSSVTDLIKKELVQNPYVRQVVAPEIIHEAKVELEPVTESAVEEPVIEALQEFEAVVLEPEIVKEDVNKVLIERLQETITSLRSSLIEQQNNQTELVRLMTSLSESLQTQNSLTEQRLSNLDSSLEHTTLILHETAEKLQSIAVREINIPAPIVNVALNEQKRVTKTVDRDENGLITKITEDTEQSVTQDR